MTTLQTVSPCFHMASLVTPRNGATVSAYPFYIAQCFVIALRLILKVTSVAPLHRQRREGCHGWLQTASTNLHMAYPSLWDFRATVQCLDIGSIDGTAIWRESFHSCGESLALTCVTGVAPLHRQRRVSYYKLLARSDRYPLLKWRMAPWHRWAGYICRSTNDAT